MAHQLEQLQHALQVPSFCVPAFIFGFILGALISIANEFLINLANKFRGEQLEKVMEPVALIYLKTAIDLATFLVSERLPVTIENFRKFFRRKPTPLAPQFESPKEITFIEKLVIDPELLATLDAQVRKDSKEYIECLKRAQRSQERDACDRRVERGICETLNRIRDKNDNELPTDYLNNQWRSYKCERF